MAYTPSSILIHIKIIDDHHLHLLRAISSALVFFFLNQSKKFSRTRHIGRSPRSQKHFRV
jgi:hypothetical protein